MANLVGRRLVKFLDHGGWLMPKYYNKTQQEKLYNHTVDLSRGSNEQAEMRSDILGLSKKSHPLSYYKLVYSGTSNCEKPTIWFSEASKIWDYLSLNRKYTGFPMNTNYNFDSFYSQMFPYGGSMGVHKDEYVSWGVSVSFGCTVDFLFGDQVYKLTSGDVFVADFSMVDHGILRVHEGTEPNWWNHDDVETFGRARCSIQIRNVSDCLHKIPPMNIESFKSIIDTADPIKN